MPDEEVMLKNLTGKALMGAATLAAFHPMLAEEEGRPAVRSEMLVSTAWLEKHLHDRDLVVLQIGRDRAQFDSGHIPGSRFVPLDELVEQHADSLNELPPVADLRETFESLGVGDQTRVVLLDDTGGVLAARAYFTLDYLGHARQAALLDGGLRTWMAESREISRDRTAVLRTEFHPHLQPDILISTGQMRQLSLDAADGMREYALLDARPVAEYRGLVNSESVTQAGHIAGSRSLYWKKLIRSDSNPQLLDTKELFELFRSAGAAPGGMVITYCRTGMQSSFTYFVARYLGYRSAMYDGSVYEWVRTSGNVLVLSLSPDRAVTAHQ